MNISDLRIALYSGNYNYVRDGANQALNRLVGWLLDQGAAVRVYSPTTDTPAFEHKGDLVSIPSFPFPGRGEYQVARRFSRATKRDLHDFQPNILHISSPDIGGHSAANWALKNNIALIASVHTRFETYFRYYNMAFMEPIAEAIMRRLYRKCDAIVAPSESMAQLLREQRMNYDVGIWSRGVDKDIFTPNAYDAQWLHSLGIDSEKPVIGFLGRLVMEKGLDIFSDAIDRLVRRNIAHQVLIVGEGPARQWFEQRLPHATFAGFQGGKDLGRAVASMDMLFNPSVTETFGNVTLEAMACAKPVVAARATGSASLVEDNINGRLIRPGASMAFADALQQYCEDPELRHKHGQAGLERSAKYSWDRINGQLAQTYMRLVRQHKAGLGRIPFEAIR